MKPRSGSMRRLFALLAGALAIPVLASESPAVCPAVDPPASASSSSVRAAVDPATGRLRPPTDVELRQLALARLRAAAPARSFEMVTHADGMKSVDLGDAFLFDLVMEKRPDGSASLRCVPRAAPARASEEK